MYIGKPLYDFSQPWNHSWLVYHGHIGEVKSITKENKYETSIQNPSQSGATKESKDHKEQIEPNDSAFRVIEHERGNSVALRKDIIKKSIMRSFVRYYKNLFEFNTMVHTSNGWQYGSLKAHICEVFNSSCLRKLFLQSTDCTCDLGKLKVDYFLWSFHSHKFSSTFYILKLD